MSEKPAPRPERPSKKSPHLPTEVFLFFFTAMICLGFLLVAQVGMG